MLNGIDVKTAIKPQSKIEWEAGNKPNKFILFNEVKNILSTNPLNDDIFSGNMSNKPFVLPNIIPMIVKHKEYKRYKLDNGEYN